jgi:hypothetical protein
LVKSIMELHGGTVELSSEVGVGTRVTVTFPPSRAEFGRRSEAPGAPRPNTWCRPSAGARKGSRRAVRRRPAPA